MKRTSGFMTAVLSLCLLLPFFVLSACMMQPQELVSAESVEVVRIGRKITVYDRLSGSEYHFSICRTKRTEAEKTAKTAVQTPTIRIEIIPGGGLLIESDGTVYEATPKAGRCERWQKKYQTKNS